MRKASQSSGNHHGLGHTPKSFVYLASADVQSEHHLPLLPRQPWESFSMEKLKQLFIYIFLCYAIDSAPGATAKCGVLLLPWFSQTLFFIKAYDVSNFPPAICASPWHFFEKSLQPHRSHHQSRTPCLLQWRFPAALGKVSGTSFQVFVSPLAPDVPLEPKMLPSSDSEFPTGLWGFTYGNFSHWICAAFSKHPSIRIYSVYSKVGHAISKETTHLDHRCCAGAMYTLP